MLKLPSSALEAISTIVDSLFDRMALRLLGNIPALKNKKLMIFSSEEHYNLPNLFIQALGKRAPTKIEEDVLKTLLGTAHNYIEALKSKTKAKLTEELGAVDRSKEDSMKKIVEVLGSSKSHFKTIAETEATKARNLGRAMKISKVAGDMGVEDPSVYFVLVRDSKTCHYCIKNHTVDGIVPKVFKLIEVKMTYLTKEEKEAGKVSISDQHPNGRCSLVFLSPGFGFNSGGRITYIGLDHDQYEHQNKTKA